MESSQLSTEVLGYTLNLKNGHEYKLSMDSGAKLEAVLITSDPPKFVRVKCDGDVAIININMVAELRRDTTTVHYKADW